MSCVFYFETLFNKINICTVVVDPTLLQSLNRVPVPNTKLPATAKSHQIYRLIGNVVPATTRTITDCWK